MKSLLNRNYIIITTIAALFYISAYMLNSVCGKYSIQLGAGKNIAGAITCVFTLASFFTRPVWGWLTDRYSRKKVIYAGSLRCFAAGLILLFTGNLWALAGARLLYGCGYSAFTTAGGTVVCDVTERDNLQAAVSVYGITNVISQAVAPAFALWLYGKGFRLIALAVCCIMVVVAVGSIFVKYNEKQFLYTDKPFEIYEKTALPAAKVVIYFAICTASVYSFVPVMAEERNFQATGLFFAVSAAGLLSSRLFNTKITSRYGVNRVFYAGVLMFTAGFILIAFARKNIFFFIAAALYGIGGGLVHPVLNTAAVSACRENRRGLATGTFMMSQDLGMTAGALLWGVTSEKAGFVVVYLMAAAFALMMICAFRKNFGNKQQKLR